MSNILQVCLYNTDPEASREIRTHIDALNFVRILAEVGTPEELAAILQGGEVNLVFFHLDPKPDAVVAVIDQVASRYPEFAMVALSHETAPDAILAPIRAGCDQFVCEPIDSADLSAAVGRVASKRLLSHGKSRCVCVVGASGGAGSTSIACNLAMEAAHLSEKKCALIDLDLQFGDVASNFDCDPKYTLFDLCQTGESIDQSVMEGVLTELPCKVSLLARPEMVEQYASITPDSIHNVVELLANTFPTVVADMPRRIDPCTFAAAGQADLILVVCQLVVPSIRNTKRYFDALVRSGIPDDRIEVVVNRGDSSTGRITQKDLEELIHKPVFATVPNDYQFVARSLDFGRPIAALDRNSQVRMSIRKMAAKIVAGPTGRDNAGTSRRGFLGRLLSK